MASARAKTRLSCRKEIKEQQQCEDPDSPVCTPTKNKAYQCDRDYSPVFIPCTQESLENMDVLWDWNSPQSKIALTRKCKRIEKSFSPKLPIKRHPSNSQITSFDRLKENVRAFQEENKLTPSSNVVFDDNELELDKNSNNNELDDLFDDSIEQELLLVSQQIEDKFINKPNSLNFNVKVENCKLQSPLNSKLKASPRNLLTKSYSLNTLDSPIRESPIKRPVKKNSFNFSSKLQELKNESMKNNDSLELAFDSFDDDDFNILNEINTTSKANSTPNSTLKLKTKSFSFGDHYTEKSTETVLDEHVLKEIERKRLEALAKLKAKKKQELMNSDSDTSPIKCSPEEIENKRLMALAKLEAKKKLDIIEKNRQEALRKLEMNRKIRQAKMDHCSLR